MEVVRMGIFALFLNLEAFNISPLSLRLAEGFELKDLFHFIKLRKYSFVLQQLHLEMERLPPK